MAKTVEPNIGMLPDGTLNVVHPDDDGLLPFKKAHKTIECLYCFKWYIKPCATQQKAAACANLAAAKLIANGGTLIGAAQHAIKVVKAKGKPKRKK